MLHCKKQLAFLEAEQLWSVLQLGILEVCLQLIPVVEPSTLSVRLRYPSWEQAVRPGAQETRLHPSPETALRVFYVFVQSLEACQILRIMQGASLITSTSIQAHAVSALYPHCAQVAFPRRMHTASLYSLPPCYKPSSVECAKPIGKGQNAQV